MPGLAVTKHRRFEIEADVMTVICRADGALPMKLLLDSVHELNASAVKANGGSQALVPFALHGLLSGFAFNSLPMNLATYSL